MKTKVIITLMLLSMCLDLSSSRRHGKIVISGPTPRHNLTPDKKADYDFNEYEYAAPTAPAVTEEHDEPEQKSEIYAQTKSILHTKKPGFSAGSGLRSIAQGSADQASSAVSNQHAAAKQAAYVAQNTLAQAAAQAAATAQAALAGKQVLLQGLEQQNIDARQALEGEIQQLQQAKRSAKAAQQAAHQAMNHVQVLTAALNNAQKASEHAQQSATEAAAELASQTAMVGSAKARLEHVEEQLHAARIDFGATQHAATSAAASAQQAQNNAAAAAVHASLVLKEAETVQHHEYVNNHSYAHVEYKQSSPQAQISEQQQPPPIQQSAPYDFVSYRRFSDEYSKEKK